MQGVTILGATGSIGLSTLDVLSRQGGRFCIVALTANKDVQRMAELCRIHRPTFAVMANCDAAQQLQDLLRKDKLDIQILGGSEGLEYVVALTEVHVVMAAIVGAAGLLPTLAAARAGKRILLANKEALVMSGKLFMDVVKAHGAQLLPVDSEHNAIFQCMPPRFNDGLDGVGVKNILLTASGGPFRTMAVADLHSVTPQQACAHPNWVMGRKISVDSATMMNKGLEVIEACWLFNVASTRIKVVLHPQSVIHSMVEYVDGSILAQLGSPDMRTPIAHALAWPDRIESGVKTLDLFSIARLDFEPPDVGRFPCLRFAYEAIERGDATTTVLNAANEVAVAAFLEHRLPFLGIPRVIEATMENLETTGVESLQAILEVDQQAREWAQREISRVGERVVS